MSDTETPTESNDVEISLDGLKIDDFAFDQKKSEKEQAIIEGGDEDELARFRREWKAEVKGRRGLRVYGIPYKESEAKEVPKVVDETLASPERSPRKSKTSPFAEDVSLPDPPPQNGRTLDGGPSRPKKQYSAVQLYAQAVENEQAGQLNDALQLYRRAFKIDDNVDRVYQRSLPKHVPEEEETDTPTSTDIVSASIPQDEPYSFQRHLQFQPDYQKTKTPRKRSPLSTLLDKASVQPDDAVFVPEEEDKPFPISLLPPELLGKIFDNLDVRALERFGSTCWRARLLTSQADTWKRRVQTIYRWPVVDEQISANDLVERHDGEWRTTFVEEERVRMDGSYISVCHYIRPGSGDEWVAVTHMITYHRFLRFYPDGSVISFLTTDHPSTVVPVLRPSLRSKGLHFGRWRVHKGKVYLTELLEPGTRTPKYEFEMELYLKETQRGRWNKLDIHTYSSINLATDEVLGLSLKHQKPFYFSKVKSYHPAL